MSQQAQEDVIIDRIVRVYQDEEDGGFYNYYGKDYVKKIYEVFPTIRKFIKVFDAGWEVEQTPEEKIQKIIEYHSGEFNRARSENIIFSYRYHDGFIDGALQTLNIIGIKPKG